MSKEIAAKVVICKEGLVAMKLCAKSSLTDEEIETEINLMRPTGINSSWEIEQAQEHTQCDDHADRTHVIVYC